MMSCDETSGVFLIKCFITSIVEALSLEMFLGLIKITRAQIFAISAISKLSVETKILSIRFEF